MKKSLSIILSVLLLSVMFVFSVSAVAEPTIQVGYAEARRGEIATLNVEFIDNPGINTYNLTFSYDETRLEFIECESVLPGNFTYYKSAVWFNSVDMDHIGTFMTVTFRVLENAPEGDAKVTVTYNPGDICNYDEEDVSFTVKAGKVTVHEHSYTSKVTKSATCTTAGTKTYTCSCGDSYTEAIPATGHNSNTNLSAVSATCTKTGLTAGKKCSVCGTITVAQKIVAKTSHKETTISGKAATYTSTGLTAGKKCSVCNTVTVKQTTVAKLTLGKVSGLKAKTVKVAKSSEITLSWNKIGDGVKYEVYQQNGKKWKKVKTTTKTSYTVKKLKSNKSYKFRVRAVVDDIKGKYSSTLKVETIPSTATLKLKAGKKQLTASWSKVSDISGYEVQYSTSKKFTKKTTKTVKVKKSSKKTTVKKLKKGKKYFVRIRTYKTVDGKKIYSDWSKVKNVKVK